MTGQEEARSVNLQSAMGLFASCRHLSRLLARGIVRDGGAIDKFGKTRHTRSGPGVSVGNNGTGPKGVRRGKDAHGLLKRSGYGVVAGRSRPDGVVVKPAARQSAWFVGV